MTVKYFSEYRVAQRLEILKKIFPMSWQSVSKSESMRVFRCTNKSEPAWPLPFRLLSPATKASLAICFRRRSALFKRSRQVSDLDRQPTAFMLKIACARSHPLHNAHLIMECLESNQKRAEKCFAQGCH